MLERLDGARRASSLALIGLAFARCNAAGYRTFKHYFNGMKPLPPFSVRRRKPMVDLSLELVFVESRIAFRQRTRAKHRLATEQLRKPLHIVGFSPL